MKNKINGFIFYKGPSQIDGFPVVGIAVLNSRNSKTGNMIQTYIINDNGLSPLENSRQKKDPSILIYTIYWYIFMYCNKVMLVAG